MILITTEVPFEQRKKQIAAAHKVKREFGRVVAEELPRALLAETKFRDSIDPKRGIRAALKGGPGSISETTDKAGTVTVTTGIEYDRVPWWRIQDRGGIIRAKNVRNLTIPATDAAAMELYRAGGARNIPGLKFVMLEGRPALVKESSPEEKFIWLKPSVKIPARAYVAPGIERFRRTSWKRLAETLPGVMFEGGR